MFENITVQLLFYIELLMYESGNLQQFTAL